MKKMFVLILCCIVLAGCTSAPADDTMPTFARVETTAPIPEIAETMATEHYITLYAPNEGATGFIYASVEVSEISADAICNALIGADVLEEDVRFNSLVVGNGQILLDVNDAFGRQLMSYGTAGEYMMVGSVVNTLLSAYGAESVYITLNGQTMESGHVIYDFPQEFYENQVADTSQSEEEHWDLIPTVMVDGRLYVATGHESTITARCGMMDGAIDSQVESWQTPTENNQSNFGVGYGYQFGTEPGTIEVNMDGTWWVYATLSDERLTLIEAVSANVITFDEVEYVDIPSPRAEALGVTPENTPGTFFLHNETTLAETFPISPECVCTVFDWYGDYVQKTVTPIEFAELIAQRDAPNIPYYVTTENGMVTGIEELLVP